jgi:hypothetical protein
VALRDFHKVEKSSQSKQAISFLEAFYIARSDLTKTCYLMSYLTSSYFLGAVKIDFPLQIYDINIYNNVYYLIINCNLLL